MAEESGGISSSSSGSEPSCAALWSWGRESRGCGSDRCAEAACGDNKRFAVVLDEEEEEDEEDEDEDEDEKEGDEGGEYISSDSLLSNFL